MTRWPLIVLLVVGVVCAGIGVALVGNPFHTPTFGWTADAPLAGSASGPIDTNWLVWAPRIGTLLLALGAGCTGAALAALVLRRRSKSGSQPGD